MKKYLDIKNLFILFFIHIISHFMPFERASIGQDEFASLVMPNLWFKNFIVYPDRPLMFFYGEIHKFIINNIYFIDFYLLILTSFLPVIIFYYLLKIYLQKIDLVFLILVIYSLMINKLEVYHTTVYIHIMIVTSFYLLSILFFVLFVNNNKNKIFFSFSLIFYFLALLWYELGILIPFIFLIFYYLKYNDFNIIKYFKILLPYGLIVLIYFIYRFTGAFGLSEHVGREANLVNIITGLTDVFHHHFGRYIIRNLIYGTYLFFKINIYWLIIIILSDIIILSYIYFRLKKINNLYLNKNILLISLTIIFLTLFPNILAGGSGGRHLIISSIGFSIIIFVIVLFFEKSWKKLYILLMLVFLIVCQGNSWAQVVSLRIANNLYSTIKIYSEEISKSDVVIIDKKSFANNIPYTMLKRDYNVFHTYYGAQALEDWGIAGMLYLSSKKKKFDTTIYFSVKDIIFSENQVDLTIIRYQGYNNFIDEKIKILNKDIFILDYSKVYPNGHINGNKK